jgi:hypothetical protein
VKKEEEEKKIGSSERCFKSNFKNLNVYLALCKNKKFGGRK